jgi:diacylglycerol kinase (ATP)
VVHPFISGSIAEFSFNKMNETLATPHKSTGFKRIVRALWHSLSGIGSAWKHESAFRQELILSSLLVPLAVILPVGLTGKTLLIGCVFLVLITELLNSAIEWIVDYISLDHHPMAKRAKDMGSAAVFLSLLNCGIIWLLVLSEKWPQIEQAF